MNNNIDWKKGDLAAIGCAYYSRSDIMEPKLLTRWQIAKVVSLKRDGTPSKLTNGRATLPLAHYLRNAERTQMSAIQRVKSEAVDADGALRAWVALDDHEEFVDWPGSESGHGALKAFVRQFLIG